MPADDALLFIDANKYLDLYSTHKGTMLLAPLGEQVDYIFVTQQVVDEVQRNKISVAAAFLDAKFTKLKLRTFGVPDHLSGTSADQGNGILQQMGEIVQKIEKANDEVDALALDIMEQISRSEDEVSKALAPIFAKAVPHSPEELQRARDRRELGNPPGKIANPIGDQLIWEQILTHFKGKKRLWIISRDRDYGTFYDGKGFLNRFLYDELCEVASAPEVYLFGKMVEGIEHFVETTGVKADNRLTPEEAQEIEKEEHDSMQPGEGYRRMIEAMTMAELPQPSVDMSRMIAEFTRDCEDTCRMMAELQPRVDMRQMIAEFTQSSEHTRRMMAEFTQPNEDVRRMIAEATRSSEDIGRMVAELTHRLHQPPAPTHQSPKGDQEENDEQPPTSPPSPQKGDNEEEKNEEGEAG